MRYLNCFAGSGRRGGAAAQSWSALQMQLLQKMKHGVLRVSGHAWANWRTRRPGLSSPCRSLTGLTPTCCADSTPTTLFPCGSPARHHLLALTAAQPPVVAGERLVARSLMTNAPSADELHLPRGPRRCQRAWIQIPGNTSSTSSIVLRHACGRRMQRAEG